MLISSKTFINGTEVDLTNGEHQFPNLTLRQHTMYPESFVIENYLTRKTFTTFSSLKEAIDYCNSAFNTDFKFISDPT